MKLSFLALPLFGLIAGSVVAEPEATTTPVLNEPPKATQALAPRKPAPPAAAHELSAETSAKIGGTLPKFSPSTAPVVRTRTAELPDLRDIDKPRNTIIRLPKEIVEKRLMPHATESTEMPTDVVQLPAYEVREQKAPQISEREMLTPAGKLQLAYKRHPGLRFNPLPFLGSNDSVALEMLEAELRLERMSEMRELTSLYGYSDPKSEAAMKQATDAAFSRSNFTPSTRP